jgi:hypothetical protein
LEGCGEEVPSEENTRYRMAEGEVTEMGSFPMQDEAAVEIGY